MARKSSSPKRRIERVKSIVVDTAVDGSVEEVILHTAEDAKTLIRAWGDLRISPIDTAMTTTVACHVLMAINPASTAVVSPGVSNSLDVPVPLQEIASWWGEGMQNDTNGIIATDKIQFDMKAQRLMREADEVVLRYVASTANDLRLRGVIYLWFKE